MESVLNKIIHLDDENIEASKRNLCQLNADALKVVEAYIEAFEIIAEKYGRRCDYDAKHKILNEWARSMGFKGNEALAYLKDAVLIGDGGSGDKTPEARRAFDEAVAVIAKAQLTLRIGRDFVYGLTDLLRLRITGSLGYLRLQAESCGILMLFLQNPALAEEWTSSINESIGKKFYRDNHAAVKGHIQSMGLSRYYEMGSNMAFHPRAAGTAMGIMMGAKGAAPGEIRLVYQEIDTPQLLFLFYEYYLRFHTTMLVLINKLYPELSDDDLKAIGILDIAKRHRRLQETSHEIAKTLGESGISRLLSNTMEHA